MTYDQLVRVCPNGKPALMQGFVACVNEEGHKYGVNSLLSLQHFVAQCAHESDGFKTFEEYASGKAYEGRKDLGNTLKGDGVKFKGRGAIQLTGRFNYAAISKAVKVDYVLHPEWLSGPINGTRAALWYWKERGLSALAEKDDLVGITRKVNGGLNGIDNRRLYLERAKKYIVLASTELQEPEMASVEPVEVDPLSDLPKTREQTWVWKALQWWKGD